MQDPRFETARLSARPWSVDDAEAAFEIYSDPEVVRYLDGVVVETLEAQIEWLEVRVGRITGYGEPFGAFSLTDKSTQAIVGTALIKPVPDGSGALTGDIEIGWHLARRHWRKGYATEAGRALLRYGFDDSRLDRLVAVVQPINVASQRVATRIGMEHQGRSARYYGEELELYALTRQQWIEQIQRPGT